MVKSKIFKMVYGPDCVQNSGLKATDFFVILLSYHGFESNRSETKFQTFTFYSQFEVPCRTLDSYF